MGPVWQPCSGQSKTGSIQIFDAQSPLSGLPPSLMLTQYPPWHAVPPMQAGPLCQVPVLSQACGVVGLAHCAEPGMHEPVQAPAPLQTSGQVWLVCQVPAESQDWETVPEQRVLPETQLPVHAPAPEQAYGQVLVSAHWPLTVHVCTPLPAHCAWPGPHTPVHAPSVQVAPAPHPGPLFCQAPVASHVWGCCPSHLTAPGLHAAQAPLRHTGVVPEQGAPTLCHVPAPVQNCGCWPLQDNVPAEQPESDESIALASTPAESTPPLDPELLEPEHVPAPQVSPALHAVPLQHGSPEPPQLVVPSCPPVVAAGPESTLPFAPLEVPQLATRETTRAKPMMVAVIFFIVTPDSAPATAGSPSAHLRGPAC